MITLLRTILVASLLGTAACTSGTDQAETSGHAPPPTAPTPTGANVILISVDTLRADYLACYGESRYPEISPSIDALAADGVLFEHFISAAPWTTPAHMSLITSLYPSSHGVTDTFPEFNERRKAGETFSRLADTRITLAEVFAAHGYETRACTGGVTLDPKIGFDQGFEHYDQSMYKLGDPQMDDMLAWIRAPRDGPFFLFWHTFEVHAPYLHTHYLPEQHNRLPAQFAELAPALSTMEDIDQHLANNEKLVNVLKANRAYDAQTCRDLYAGGVRSMDQWLERLVAALRAANLYDDTLIVFTSDHGDEFAERDADAFYDVHGHTLFEELIRVPLILKLPGQAAAGARVTGVVRTVDIMPTVLDLVGIAHPEELMQGESLRYTWETNDDAERIAYSESAVMPFELKCLRSDRYKYVVRVHEQYVQEHGRNYIPPDPQDVMLFDLVDDPGETNNLLADDTDATHSTLAADFDERLRAFVSAQHSDAEEVVLDEETIRKLKALGYID